MKYSVQMRQQRSRLVELQEKLAASHQGERRQTIFREIEETREEIQRLKYSRERPSGPMLSMMINIQQHGQCMWGISGQSAHGGSGGTIMALKKRKWAIFGDVDKLTPEGERALDRGL